MKIIQLRRGSAKEWKSVNPILMESELIHVTDQDTFRIGDGKTKFNDLKVWDKCIPVENAKLYINDKDSYNIETND